LPGEALVELEAGVRLGDEVSVRHRPGIILPGGWSRGRASTITQQPLQSRPIMAGNACRSFKRETAVVPAEHVAGIIAIEQAATRKPTQHPAA